MSVATSFDKNCWATKVGILPGDEIVSVNGVNFDPDLERTPGTSDMSGGVGVGKSVQSKTRQEDIK